MKLKVLVLTLTTLIGLQSNVGTITDPHYIQFNNGGYYTEHTLDGVGDTVVVIGDIVISTGGLIYLK